MPEYILNKGDFDLQYDFEKSQFYLQKEEAFQPGEIKKFQVQVENVWFISEGLIHGYMDDAKNLSDQLQESAYADIARALYNEVERSGSKIIETQNQDQTIKEKIAVYRANRKRVEIIQESLEKLRRLMIQAQRDADSNKVKNVLRELSYLEKMKEISDMLFKDRLKKVAIWKVIMTIVAFLIVITTFFYTVWFLQLKKDEKREMKKIMPEPGGKKL